MAKEFFTDAQIEAARELTQKLYELWSTETNNGARLLAASFFLTTVAMDSVPTKADGQRLLANIAERAAATLDDLGGVLDRIPPEPL